MPTQPSAIGYGRGRLDLLGLAAEPCGSLALLVPLTRGARVRVTEVDEAKIILHSTARANFAIPVEELPHTDDPEDWCSVLDAWQAPRWTRYPLGALQACCQVSHWRPAAGLVFSIESDVPTGSGAGSSSALLGATIAALGGLCAIDPEPTRRATLARAAEWQVARGLDGWADHCAAVCGAPGEVLPVQGALANCAAPLALPPEYIVRGWPCGARRPADAEPWLRFRAAAAVGRLAAEQALATSLPTAAALAPSQLPQIAAQIPESIEARRAAAQIAADRIPYNPPGDATLEPRAALAYAVFENFRCQVARQLLAGGLDDPGARLLGELLLQSHAAGAANGLGTAAGDAIVGMARAWGPDRGILGARASGYGGGGAVVILLHRTALDFLEDAFHKWSAARSAAQELSLLA
jgi:L-arabinokinase